MSESELTQEIRPPKSSIGVLPWLKENLFSTWYNTLLTLAALGFVYVVLKGVLVWGFTDANWGVIPANLQLFMIGAYPKSEVWRVWIVLYTVCALAGLSGGVWGGLTLRFAVGIGGVGIVCALLPIGWTTRGWILGCVALLAALLFLGSRVSGTTSYPPLGGLRGSRGGTDTGNLLPKIRRWILIGWILSFPWTRIVLRGFGENAVLTTNWGGLLLTLILAAVGICFCFPLGVLLALGRRSTLPAVKWVSTAYIETVRGVPLVTILFMAQVVIPIFMPDNVRLDKVLRAMLGITLFSAAYMAENVRGGLQAIPRGQYEAAQAVGLNYPLTMLFIVLPQALRSVIPAIVGQFIALFKDTSLVTIVGLLDLLGIAKSVIANPDWLGLQAEVYIFVAAIYFVFSYSMSYVSQKIEEALGVGKNL